MVGYPNYELRLVALRLIGHNKKREAYSQKRILVAVYLLRLSELVSQPIKGLSDEAPLLLRVGFSSQLDERGASLHILVDLQKVLSRLNEFRRRDLLRALEKFEVGIIRIHEVLRDLFVDFENNESRPITRDLGDGGFGLGAFCYGFVF
jgi:hypothetical protein